jgi:hypothetical protein
MALWTAETLIASCAGGGKIFVQLIMTCDRGSFTSNTGKAADDIAAGKQLGEYVLLIAPEGFDL